MLEKTLESPLHLMEFMLVNPDYSLEELMLKLQYWCEHLTHWKDPDAGKDWGQKKKGAMEDETVG